MILLIFYMVRFLNFIVLVVIIKKLVYASFAIISRLSLPQFNKVRASRLDPNKPLCLSAPLTLNKYEYNLNPRNMAIIRTKMLHWELLM